MEANLFLSIFADANQISYNYEKRILILLILFAAAIVPASPRPITLMAKSAFQHRRMRMPSIAAVSADYENGIVVVHVSHYIGYVSVTLENNIGDVAEEGSIINENGDITVTIDGVLYQEYTLLIKLGDVVYIGHLLPD